MKIRTLENLHIAFWLFKDTAWVSDWKWFGLAMVIPTVFLAFYLAWQLRHDRAELLHSLAVCCWILANTIWMVGEFYYNDGTRDWARLFFFTGLGTISLYYVRWLYERFVLRKQA